MRPKSLRYRMFFLYLTSIMIPFFVVSSIYSYYFSLQILHNNKTNISNTLESISSGIGIYVAELNSISNIPYFNPGVFQTMEDINSGKYQDIQSSTEFLKNSRGFRVVFLKYIYNATQTISDVTFLPFRNPLSRVYIMSRNADETMVTTDLLYKDSSWYTSLLQNPKNPILYSHNDTAGNSRFSYIKTIRNVDTKKNIGIITINIPSDNINRLIRNVKLSSSSYIALTYTDGEVIYSSTDNKKLAAMKNINELPGYTSMKYQIITKPIENTSLQLIYLSSKYEVILYQTITYFLIFLITLITIILSYFIYRHKTNKITQSVSNMKDTFKRIETGDLTARCYCTDPSEFIEISNALNQMAEKLNDYIIREYKASLSQQEAEYRALQAQINPHFLYNTLNGFIALNRMGEKRLLEKSIIQLTHLFQYTCNTAAVTSIESEFWFIRQYLELQSLKYDDRLTFSVYLEPGTENIPIPKLLIQPLIENSIIHGMEPSDVPIHIQLETCIVDTQSFGNYVLIRVKDDGAGFDSTTLDSIKHIGIQNIHNRLNYQNPCNVLQIKSFPEKGTECILLIKLTD